MANNTPIVDKAEHFMYNSSSERSYDYGRSEQRMPAKVGFVYSDVARRLEIQLTEKWILDSGPVKLQIGNITMESRSVGEALLALRDALKED